MKLKVDSSSAQLSQNDNTLFHYLFFSPFGRITILILYYIIKKDVVVVLLISINLTVYL